MNNAQYDILLHWSEEDRVFVATAPDLRGCMAHGNTDFEALQNIREAIQLWLDTAHEFGDVIPTPKYYAFTNA